MRWLVATIALWVASQIVPDIFVEEDGKVALAMTAVILGLVNATVRPILSLLTLPITAVTIGANLFVTNGFTPWLAAWIAENVFEVGFVIDALLPAILCSIIVSLVSIALSFFLVGDAKRSTSSGRTDRHDEAQLQSDRSSGGGGGPTIGVVAFVTVPAERFTLPGDEFC